MENKHCDLGLIGLGVMGRNFLLNLADHGFSLTGYDLDLDKVKQLNKEKSDEHEIHPAEHLADFVAKLRRPRAIMLLVPAGKPVDSVIEDIKPLLDQGDLIIDSGNSHFNDTDRRSEMLAGQGLLFMGTGMSGGEYGARYGPSIMPGGTREGYQRVENMLSQAAAQVDGEPCVAYLGKGSAGHYVKMVHNGIEYGIMQLIAETYDLLKRGLGFTAHDLQDLYREWNSQELASYLVEITSHIFATGDEKTGEPLVEVILDAAKQKGTGKWTEWDATDLQVPTPTIDAAVAMRNLSGLKGERQQAAEHLDGPSATYGGDRQKFVGHLKDALYSGMILTYAQGMALLRIASKHYGYELDLATVARIWRGGCIIRAALLEDIRSVLSGSPNLPNLLMSRDFAQEVMGRQNQLRAVVSAAVQMGVPVPALAESLSYFDGYRSGRLPANLIQAQRDYFGSHTYERTDVQGTFHTQWRKD
ncbi:MAG: NADP-dependent phosphogluconate dehydrogenase [Deltaproteobacteria bacterium]|jgi:6-phosphogluconate dehydrogenase|nr:NADP-dependent phosphogluconate dehydrogenase [Deltaproteobacteria bacterium]